MRILGIIIVILGLAGCSAVKVPVTNEYQLSAFSTKQWSTKPGATSLLVTTPEATASYQTQEMLYVDKPFKLEAFAKNSWTAAPAEMLFPLLIQSMQRTGYFSAVTSSPYNEKADYRLDSQLLAFEQNFLKKPSVINFSVKVVLTRTSDSTVIGSRIISLQIPCQKDTPYGGVLAANEAARQFTALTAGFVISHIKQE